MGEAESKVEQGLKIHTEINYLPGFEGKIAAFESLQGLPIIHAFSWGIKSKNMSPVYAGEEGKEVVQERIKDFLKSIGSDYKNVANTVGMFEGTHLQMQEVRFEDLKDQPETRLEANFIYTTDPKVKLSIRPGDCDVSIINAKGRDQKGLAGLIHSSALSTNAGLPRFSIDYLVEHEGVDPSSIKIGITPGISKHHYSMSQEPDVLKNMTIDKVIVERNWKQHIDPRDPNLGDEQLRAVDITGATIMQFIEAGVLPHNIEVFDLDTYESSENGTSFSHRHSSETGKPEGRYMIVVQLKPKKVEENLDSELKAA